MQKTPTSTTAGGSVARPGQRALLRALAGGTLALAVLLCAIAILVPVLFERVVAPELHAAAMEREARVEIASVRWAFPSGVSVRGLSVHRDGDQARHRVLHVPELRASLPLSALPALLRDRRRALERARIVVRDPELTLRVSAEDGGDIAWLREHVGRQRTPLSATAPPSGSGTNEAFPSMTVIGGFVTLDDPSGLLPGAGARLEEIVLAAPATVPRRFADTRRRSAGQLVHGSVRVEGLGRALIRGEIGGDGGAGFEARLVQDNDLALLLPERWRPRAEAMLSLGAIRFEAPGDLVLQPARGRHLEIRLPGGAAGQVDAFWAHELRLRLRSSGFSVEAVEARIRVSSTAPGEPVDQEMRLPLAEIRAPWGGTGSQVSLAIEDSYGRQVRMLADLDADHAPSRVMLEADHVALESFSALLHVPGTLAVKGGLLEGVATWHAERGGWRAEVRASLLDGALSAPALATGMMTRARLELDARLSLREGDGVTPRRLALDHAGIVVGEVPFELALWLEALGSNRRAGLDLSLPPVEADRIRRSLPTGFSPVLESMRFEGTLGLVVSAQSAPWDEEDAHLEVSISDDAFRIVDFGQGLPPERMAGDFTLDVHFPDGALRRIGPSQSGWIALDGELPLFARAILAAEDDRFFRHEGVDMRAIAAAVHGNLEEGRLHRGGSTLTQQVAKNLYTDSGRSLARKIEEILWTRELEAALSKRRILEIYLAMAHLGPGLYGVDEAARTWFGRAPRDLDLLETVFLGAILPGPELFGMAYARGELPACRTEKMENILRNLRWSGVIDMDTMVRARDRVRRGDISRTPPPSAARLEGRADLRPFGAPL